MIEIIKFILEKLTGFDLFFVIVLSIIGLGGWYYFGQAINNSKKKRAKYQLMFAGTIITIAASGLALNHLYFVKKNTPKYTESLPPQESTISIFEESQIDLTGDGNKDLRLKTAHNLTKLIDHINQASIDSNYFARIFRISRNALELCTVDGVNSVAYLVGSHRPHILMPNQPLKLTNIGSGRFEVRGFPVVIHAQEAILDSSDFLVFKIDSNGKVARVDFAIKEKEYRRIIDSAINKPDADRLRVIDFLENLKTAYNEKRIDFIKQVFSDSALIIVGFVMKTYEAKRDFLSKNSKNVNREVIRLIKQNKSTYLKRLQMVFNRYKTIKIAFVDSTIKVTRYADIPAYTVTLRQVWTSTKFDDSKGYEDDGHLFFLLDFREPENGVIWVRAWFPLSNFPESPLKPRNFELSHVNRSQYIEQ